MRFNHWMCMAVMAMAASWASAAVIVDYTVDAGGSSHLPLNGLAAQATFSLDGTELTVLLENASAGVPGDFDTSDSLLVSLGMNLPGMAILSGNAATIGPASIGLGAWSGRGPGDSVAEEWLWTNDFGGDLMTTFAQVLSTSNGQGGGTVVRFDGQPGTVDGPFGGIAAMPPLLAIPQSKPAVSDSIQFTLTLTGTLTESQLQTAARSSIVEFGSDRRYLSVPEPGAVALLAVGAVLSHRRRRWISEPGRITP